MISREGDIKIIIIICEKGGKVREEKKDKILCSFDIKEKKKKKKAMFRGGDNGIVIDIINRIEV